MNKGVAMLMNLGVLASRWGALGGSEAQRSEMKGLRGALNIEFTGDEGGAWHVVFDDGRATIAKGRAEDARAAVRLRPEDYLAMLAGDLAYSMARMTGRVRMSGDGNFGFVFGALVENLKAAQSAPGMAGWVARSVVRRALKKGDYRPPSAGGRRSS